MNFLGFSIYQYDLPLLEKAPLKKRRGLLIEITDDRGISGWGEVSPLPGFSRETLSDSLRQLLALKSGKELPSMYPSVRFGMEMAMLNLTGKQREVPMRCILAEDPCDVLPVNGLLSANQADVFTRARELLKKGVEVLKIKVGQQSIDEDIRVVERISQFIEEPCRLRLDANGSWDLPSALAFGHLCHGLPIEYIEEPVRGLDELREFALSTELPIALDETLWLNPRLSLSEVPGLKAIIVKPTFFGGIAAVKQLLGDAWKMGLTTVISSCFESSLGVLALANFACSLPSNETPAGLSTFVYFADDVLTCPLSLEDGKLHLCAFDESVVDKSKSWITMVSS